MTKRKAITTQMIVDCLLSRLCLEDHRIHVISEQVQGGGGWGWYFKCGICGKGLFPGQKIQFDHIHAVSMGGPHTFRNLRPTHAACNQAKGIKEHRAKSKVDRILGLTCNGPKRRIPSRPFPKRAA